MTNTILEIAQGDLSTSAGSSPEVIVKKRTRRKVAVKEIDVVASTPPTDAIAPLVTQVTSVVSEPAASPAGDAVESAPSKQVHHQNPRNPRHQQRQHNNKNNPHRQAAQNNSSPAAPQNSRSTPIDWPAMASIAQEHNDNIAMFWKVLAIYETDKAYLHLVKKDLIDTQLEIFEDDRVTEAVMRGARPPSIEEHWRKVYRDEMKALQGALKGVNAWISDTVPEKKHTLHWGEKIARSNNVDKDSQEFYLKKEQKKPKRQEQWRNKSAKGSARFG